MSEDWHFHSAVKTVEFELFSGNKILEAKTSVFFPVYPQTHDFVSLGFLTNLAVVLGEEKISAGTFGTWRQIRPNSVYN